MLLQKAFQLHPALGSLISPALAEIFTGAMEGRGFLLAAEPKVLPHLPRTRLIGAVQQIVDHVEDVMGKWSGSGIFGIEIKDDKEVSFTARRGSLTYLCLKTRDLYTPDGIEQTARAWLLRKGFDQRTFIQMGIARMVSAGRYGGFDEQSYGVLQREGVSPAEHATQSIAAFTSERGALGRALATGWAVAFYLRTLRALPFEEIASAREFSDPQRAFDAVEYWLKHEGRNRNTPCKIDPFKALVRIARESEGLLKEFARSMPPRYAQQAFEIGELLFGEKSPKDAGTMKRELELLHARQLLDTVNNRPELGAAGMKRLNSLIHSDGEIALSHISRLLADERIAERFDSLTVEESRLVGGYCFYLSKAVALHVGSESDLERYGKDLMNTFMISGMAFKQYVTTTRYSLN